MILLGTISQKEIVIGEGLQALLVGGMEAAWGASPIAVSDTHQVADGAAETYTTIDVNNGGTLAIARNAKVSGSDVTVNTGGTLTSAKNLHFGSLPMKTAGFFRF